MLRVQEASYLFGSTLEHCRPWHSRRGKNLVLILTVKFTP